MDSETGPFSTTRGPAPSPRVEGLGTSGLQLAALSAFAIAQPLFEILGRNATFFVARRSEPIDILLLTAILVLVPPGLLLGIEALVGLVASRLRSAVHLFFITGLSTLVLLPPLVRAFDWPGWLTVLVALAGGTSIALAFSRFQIVGTFLAFSSLASLIFAGVFLAQPSVRQLTSGPAVVEKYPGVDTDVSIVFIVLDELPLASLMNRELEIDRQLFPNFARLADDSTWYRNATATHQSSERSIPAILTGLAPRAGDKLATAIDHPRSLFSALAGTHRMKVQETFTSLLPRSLSKTSNAQPLTSRLMADLFDVAIIYCHLTLPEPSRWGVPGISGRWGGFSAGLATPSDNAGTVKDPWRRRWKKERDDRAFTERQDPTPAIRRFIDSIDDSLEPTLYFLHVLTPHHPWNRTPSGKYYTHEQVIAGYQNNSWDEQVWPPALAYQRHLFQVGYVDSLLGEILDQLEAKGIYDRSLVLLVADHGASFRPSSSLRAATKVNRQDIASVPLLIKRPFQSESRRDDHNIEGVDILPTLAGILDFELPWEVDGVDVTTSDGLTKSDKTLYRNRKGPPLVTSGRLPTEWYALEEKTRLFGEHPTWNDIYRLSSRPELLGLAVRDLPATDRPVSGTARLANSSNYSMVETTGKLLPCYVEGTLEAEGNLPSTVVLAVNGWVRAVVPTYDVADGTAKFAAMLPEESFHDGANSMEVFALTSDGSLQGFGETLSEPSYRLISPSGETEHILSSAGRRINIAQAVISTHINSVVTRAGGVHISGWAVDKKRLEAAERILVFLEGTEAAITQTPNFPRPGLRSILGSGDYAEHCGFRLALPKSSATETGTRFFAILGQTATEFFPELD